MDTKVVLATANPHKVAELTAILGDVLGEIAPGTIGLASEFGLGEVREDAVTFAGNALLKARAACAVSGLPAVADDSGLVVDMLGAAPGVLSARWCGRHGDDAANLALLLAQLADVPDEHRGARFVCAAALVWPDGTGPDGAEVVEIGEMAGTLLREPRGAGGFGYDPIFRADSQSVSNAELTPAQKNAISHRGAAFRALAPHLARALS